MTFIKILKRVHILALCFSHFSRVVHGVVAPNPVMFETKNAGSSLTVTFIDTYEGKQDHIYAGGIWDDAITGKKYFYFIRGKNYGLNLDHAEFAMLPKMGNPGELITPRVVVDSANWLLYFAVPSTGDTYFGVFERNEMGTNTPD
jgi:hypothetical protein